MSAFAVSNAPKFQSSESSVNNTKRHTSKRLCYLPFPSILDVTLLCCSTSNSKFHKSTYIALLLWNINQVGDVMIAFRQETFSSSCYFVSKSLKSSLENSTQVYQQKGIYFKDRRNFLLWSMNYLTMTLQSSSRIMLKI